MPDRAPANLIRHGKLEENRCRLFAGDAAALPPDEANWMVSLELWRALYPALRTRKHPLGILIPADADPQDFAGANILDAGSIALLAIDFPSYTDGRGFSLAQILRQQWGWQGELRAVGDVLIDTMHYLARCGFDSFLVKPGHDPQLALQALRTFTVHYQRAYAAPAAAGWARQ